jgi:shikimate kinase
MNTQKPVRLALTGFMGVGKSSVARHLANRLRCKWIDLDRAIEDLEKMHVAQVIDTKGLEAYRAIETRTLAEVVKEQGSVILSLGGGTWTLEGNRQLIKAGSFESVWLEATFEHCWLNITFSRKQRPLARDKQKALQLFEERLKVYCLADSRFVVRNDSTSYDVAKRIADEMFA